MPKLNDPFIVRYQTALFGLVEDEIIATLTEGVAPPDSFIIELDLLNDWLGERVKLHGINPWDITILAQGMAQLTSPSGEQDWPVEVNFTGTTWVLEIPPLPGPVTNWLSTDPATGGVGLCFDFTLFTDAQPNYLPGDGCPGEDGSGGTHFVVGIGNPKTTLPGSKIRVVWQRRVKNLPEQQGR
jgi:hypothetical protein